MHNRIHKIPVLQQNIVGKFYTFLQLKIWQFSYLQVIILLHYKYIISKFINIKRHLNIPLGSMYFIQMRIHIHS
jgi:hypothetical protein